MDTSNALDWVNGLSQTAASWYNGVSRGTIVVPPAFTPAQVGANQALLNQQLQANLAQSNPALAGLLANPIVIIIGIGLLVVALIFAFKA
jgi:hypothetical protein